MNIINGTIYDLLVREYASQWRDIGAALGFSQGEMNTIQANPLLMLQTPPKSWLRELLTQWMQWEPGDQRGSTAIPTREALRAALLKANLGNVAEMIKDA